MTVVEKTRVQQAELHKKLWAMTNDLRGNMGQANSKTIFFKSNIL